MYWNARGSLPYWTAPIFVAPMSCPRSILIALDRCDEAHLVRSRHQANCSVMLPIFTAGMLDDSGSRSVRPFWLTRPDRLFDTHLRRLPDSLCCP
jgi:hypothetical protein